MTCSGMRVRLTINGTNIPTVNQGVTTEISNSSQKNGPDLTRLTEAFVPLEWKDEDITSGIQAFDPTSQSNYDKATVEWQHVRNPGTWTKAHRGFVRGVSGSESTGVARVIISDPASLMTAIPFSGKYNYPSTDKVFNDVVQEFNENSIFNAAVSMSASREVDGGGGGGTSIIEGAISDLSFGLLGEGSNLQDQKTFKKNRHSCADVLDWATEAAGGKWYFDLQGTNQLQLVYDSGTGSQTFVQREKSGSPQDQQLKNQGAFPQCGLAELDIISNDALAELFPINTLTVKGATGASVFGRDVSMVPGEKAPYVRVTYPPFLERAGGNVVGETIETDNVTLQSATNKAKRELEKRILDSGTGQIECYGNGSPRPYDTVVAKPECNDVLTSSVNPLTHEIAKVVHEKPATKEMITFLDVSPVVDPSEIEVESTEMRKV